MQHTLKTATQTLEGTGLHTGASVRMRILPAAPDTGLLFVRTDLSSVNTYVAAKFNCVDTQGSQLCTLLKNTAGIAIQTPEHLMAALAGCGIDNALIEIDASEVPLLDGSAKPFVEAILAAGRKQQPAARRVIRVLKPVKVEHEGKLAAFYPSAHDGLDIDFMIEFPGIGVQQHHFVLDEPQNFADEIADARTFTLRSIALALKSAGKLKGGSLDNALVLNDEDGSVYEGVARHANEPVRHKIQDAIGDLALAGMPIMGSMVCKRGGHALTNMLLRALFEDESAYSIEEQMAGMSLPNAQKRLSTLISD